MSHFQRSAEEIIRKKNLSALNGFVVEIASNDGYMLRHFTKKRIPVMGVDPSPRQAQVARRLGIPTLGTFFNEKIAHSIARKNGKADVVLANNVLAHVPNLNGFVRGIRHLLKDKGQAIFEVPSVTDLMEHVEFDTIYHQHLCYFSLTALDALFKRHKMVLLDVKHLTIHGGSFRVIVGFQGSPSRAVQKTLQYEKSVGIRRMDYYRRFCRRVKEIRKELMVLLKKLKSQGNRIVGYGAAAKANTLLNYCGVDGKILDYVVDLNTRKHGLYMGGVRLPITGVDRLEKDRPSYVLLLAWNFATEIIQQQKAYRKSGGKFIVPLPRPRVVV